MTKQVVQCVPNFSEGRRPDVIEAIVAPFRSAPNVRLADWSADADHNRMVVTCVGEIESVREAVLDACAAAIEMIDLRDHIGVHPRLGAIDVLPIVPLSGITLAECAEWAIGIGEALATRHDLPIFFYEAADLTSRSLPFVRKSAFQDLLPDRGPLVPHPSAGASVVGARGPLIAYNVALNTNEIKIARTIARELREGGGAGFIGVRSLALTLESQGIVQVSMNITKPETTSLLSVFQYIVTRSAQMGCSVVGSEVIGALPGYTAFGVMNEALQAIGLKSGQVLWENWPQ